VKLLTASFFWSLSGLLLAAASLIFLLKSLKNGRIYLIGVDGTSYYEKKQVIRQEQSPFLFKLIVRGIAVCTAITFVTCLVVVVLSTATSIDFLKVAHRWQVIVAFVPYGLVLMYVFDNISVRVFASWWDM
jgi:hypothetical protein